MSSAAVNDSIRLFLNALVTPMGHSARESAHSAERAQTLAGHQRRSHTRARAHTHRHRWTHAHTCYTPTISGVHSLIHLFICSLHVWRVSVVDSLNNMRGEDSLVERETERSLIHQGKCTLLRARVCIEIWNMPLQCCSLAGWNIHATAAADQI